MTTIDNLGEKISIDYLRSLEDVQGIQPLLKISPAIYIPALPIVHSLQPWAYFQPPCNFADGLKRIFTNGQLIPALERIEDDEAEKKRFERIPCGDDEEEEEKDALRRLFVTVKHLNGTLKVIAEQTIQYATGPLDATKGLHEEDAKHQTLLENRKAAYAYVRRGKFRISIPYLEAIVAQDPTNLQDLQTFGAVYVHVYRPEDAVACLKKCLEMDPRDAYSKLNLARAYFDLNQIGEGIDEAMPLQGHTDMYISQNATELVQRYLPELPP